MRERERERERKTERRNDLSHLLRRPIFENECLSSSVCIAFLFLSLSLSVCMYTALFLLLFLAYARAPCSLDIQTERYSMIEARKNIERTEEKPSERARESDARIGDEKSEDVSTMWIRVCLCNKNHWRKSVSEGNEKRERNQSVTYSSRRVCQYSEESYGIMDD